MKIKKQIKKERARRKNIITFSVMVMVIIPYLIVVLNDQSIFKGWESYISFSFAAVVDVLLLLNIIRISSESFFEFSITNQRIRIKDSIFRKPIVVQAERVAYVDIAEKAREDFDILIVIEKGKRHKNFENLDDDFIKSHMQYKDVYNEFLKQHPGNDYYTYIIRKTGAKKYYYLYLLYKNAYHSEFTKNAVNLIKRFMEEYNLA